MKLKVTTRTSTGCWPTGPHQRDIRELEPPYFGGVAVPLRTIIACFVPLLKERNLPFSKKEKVAVIPPLCILPRSAGQCCGRLLRKLCRHYAYTYIQRLREAQE